MGEARLWEKEMTNATLRVLVADGHEQFRWEMAHLLCAECDIVASVTDGRQLVDAAMSLLPDVVVSDVNMPGLTGLEAMEELHDNGYHIPFVLVSTTNAGAEHCVRRGAMGFVNRVHISHDLVVAVFSAAGGQVCVLRNAEERCSHTLKCA